jgi:hypothetical protein
MLDAIRDAIVNHPLRQAVDLGGHENIVGGGIDVALASLAQARDNRES